jgi:hypothetical protein
VAVLLNGSASGNFRPAISVDGAGLAIKVDDASIDADGGGQLRLKDAGVGTAKLADGAVTSAKLGDGAVLTAKIVDANVTYAKLASDVTSKIGRFDMYQAGMLSGSAPFSVTLSSAPQTQDAALLVFMNGVMRTKGSDYTLSGSTVSFVSGVGSAGDDFAIYYGISG